MTPAELAELEARVDMTDPDVAALIAEVRRLRTVIDELESWRP